MISASLIHLDGGNVAEANRLATAAEKAESSEGIYRHPLGDTRALSLAIRSSIAHRTGDAEEAMKLAERAFELDSNSSFISANFVDVLVGRGQREKAKAIAQETLIRCPGAPQLLKFCVIQLLDEEREDEAQKLLDSHRDSLSNRTGSELEAAKLSEMILRALIQLNDDVIEWDWLNHVDAKTKTFVQKAMLQKNAHEDLFDAIGLFLGKAAENELFAKVVVPFKKSLQTQGLAPDPKMRDFSRFILDESNAPGLGGIYRALRRASKKEKSSDSQLLRCWRNYIKSLHAASTPELFNLDFLERLETLSKLRNNIAHTGEITESDIDNIEKFLLDETKPGFFFTSLHPQNP